MPQVPAALSVDMEFFQHAPAYRGASDIAGTADLGLAGVEFLRDAFAEADATGTFFTVSDVADDHADLLAGLASDGHEIGSHTHTHRHLTEITAEERREELATSKERLETVVDGEVTGFRAPSFDVADDHFDLLAEAGYEYDSSVVPCRSIPGWYGGEYDTWRPSPATSVDETAPDGMAEIPVAVMPGLRLPLTGTWVRFFGVRYAILGMRLLARRGIPPVLYVHPWELVDLPDVEGVPSRVYWRSGSYMRRAVARILAEPFEFVATRTLAAEWVDGTDGASPDATEAEAGG